MSSPEDEGRRSVGIAKEQLAATIAIPGPIGKPFGGALVQSPKLKKPIILERVASWIVRNEPDSPFAPLSSYGQKQYSARFPRSFAPFGHFPFPFARFRCIIGMHVYNEGVCP